MKMSVLTVLYNQSLDEVSCIEAAMGSDAVCQVIACDNSTETNDNSKIAQKLGVDFVDMGGNKGLPAAYNAGVARCTGEVVCIFDDDTVVGQSYFQAISDLWDSDDRWDIALPLVIAGDQILSPCKFDGYRARSFSNPEQIRDGAKLSGINSGMAVKRRVYDVVCYDEGLFLDLVDHQFISSARNAGFNVTYLEGPVLRQDFSLATDSANAAARRFSIFERDAKHFYSGTLTKSLYCAVMLKLRRRKLRRKYGAVAFPPQERNRKRGIQS